jgi:hypothetical protein
VIRPSDVSPAHPQSRVRAVVKQTLLGKMALAIRRRRMRPPIPKGWLGRTPDPVTVPRGARAVVLVPVGPGEAGALYDTLESVAEHEPAALVVVLADGAGDVRPEELERRSPGAVLLRPPHPSGGPPRLSPPLAWAYGWILATLRPEVIVKLDTDALLTAPGLIDHALEAFLNLPKLGMLGATARRPDGTPGDTSYGAWVIAHECRWSPTVRRTVRAAREHGWAGDEVHGGVYVLARRALVAMNRTGHLYRDPPWWTLIGEDLWFSLGVVAAGFRIGRTGVIATAQGCLPLDAQAVLDGHLMAVHSVRCGRHGESEDELRAFFRAARRAREHA